MATTLTVIGLFMLRIGIPLILLIVVGTLIERWQTNRERKIEAMYANIDALPTTKQAEITQETEIKRAA